jgi:TPR repeat protein
LPKIWNLALRGHTGAMIDLADWFSGAENHLGPFADTFGPAGLYRRAHLKGNARAAFNLAMTCFNRNDLKGYRQWLGKAARAGDPAAKLQIARFETRLPHSAAAKIRRIRSEQKRDEFA